MWVVFHKHLSDSWGDAMKITLPKKVQCGYIVALLLSWQNFCNLWHLPYMVSSVALPFWKRSVVIMKWTHERRYSVAKNGLPFMDLSLILMYSFQIIRGASLCEDPCHDIRHHWVHLFSCRSWSNCGDTGLGQTFWRWAKLVVNVLFNFFFLQILAQTLW